MKLLLILAVLGGALVPAVKFLKQPLTGA